MLGCCGCRGEAMVFFSLLPERFLRMGEGSGMRVFKRTLTRHAKNACRPLPRVGEVRNIFLPSPGVVFTRGEGLGMREESLCGILPLNQAHIGSELLF